MTGLQSVPFGAATFIFDSSGENPTTIEFRYPALVLSHIERGQELTEEHWQKPGVYFLLGSGTQANTYRIYVGMAPTKLSRRISEQVRRKDWWDRALVVASDRRGGFSSSEVGWLEAAFIAKLRADLGETVDNHVQPAEDTLPFWHQQELAAHIPPIEAVLKLLGVLTPAMESEIVTDDEPGTAPPDGDAASVEAAGRVPQPVTWLEAAAQVLPADGTPLHVTEIVRLAVEVGLRDVSRSKTPEATLRRDLRMAIDKGDTRFRQTAPATFARSSGGK